METISIVDSQSPYMPEAYRLRHEVFVTEQNVPEELELDERDADAIHLVVHQDDVLVGTMRMHEYHGAIKIGRVAVRRDLRGTGLGRRMMVRAMERAKELGYHRALLDSQVWVQGFYEKLGFIAEGETFMEAGIEHIRMGKGL